MTPRYFKKKWTNEWIKLEDDKLQVVISTTLLKHIGINMHMNKIIEVLNTFDYCTKREFEQKFNEAKNEIGL